MDWCGAVVVTLVKPLPASMGEEVMGLWWSSVLLASTWDPLVSRGDVVKAWTSALSTQLPRLCLEWGVSWDWCVRACGPV